MNALHVPVLDVARLDDPATLRALDQACREWGFFQVTTHGIDGRLLRDLLAAAHRFFALPAADKQRIARSADNPWGYFDRELTKNTRDWKQIFDCGPADGARQRPQWPAGLPGFEAAVRGYYAACARLAARLIDAIGVNLGMPAGHLPEAFGARQSSFVRLNYYPPCPAPAQPEGLRTPDHGYLGVNHHTDAGALTILLQDAQPGLEVFRDGRWHLVEPLADALVVNVGDVVQVWSNDRYPAALHRVLANTRQPRYSAPFFYCPALGLLALPPGDRVVSKRFRYKTRDAAKGPSLCEERNAVAGPFGHNPEGSGHWAPIAALQLLAWHPAKQRRRALHWEPIGPSATPAGNANRP